MCSNKFLKIIISNFVSNKLLLKYFCLILLGPSSFNSSLVDGEGSEPYTSHFLLNNFFNIKPSKHAISKSFFFIPPTIKIFQKFFNFALANI